MQKAELERELKNNARGMALRQVRARDADGNEWNVVSVTYDAENGKVIINIEK